MKKLQKKLQCIVYISIFYIPIIYITNNKKNFLYIFEIIDNSGREEGI